MPDVARVIIASKSCSSYSVVRRSEAKRAYTCNICQGFKRNITDPNLESAQRIRNPVVDILEPDIRVRLVSIRNAN